MISYDRLLINTQDVDYYVTFNSYRIGVIQANYIIQALGLANSEGPFSLEITAGDPGDSSCVTFYQGAMDTLLPYLNSGKLTVLSGQTALADVGTKWWSTDNAQARAEDLLDTYYAGGRAPDAWLCLNDSTAQGVVQALDAKNFQGTWPVITGQDCDRPNVRYIMDGKQAMSVLKDTRTLAAKAAEMAVQALNSQTVSVNDTATYHNGRKTVPAFLCDPLYVDISNYRELLIDAGYYTEEDFD